MKIAAILLAGGVGTRMKSVKPKQFLTLDHLPISTYSLNSFNAVDSIQTLVVVAQPQYRELFQSKKEIRFASPGERRQDSVYQGLLQIDETYDYVIVHDTARPFVTSTKILELIKGIQEADAACLAVPVKYTIKEAALETFVKRTLDRATLWEIQTPQIIKRDLLVRGFEVAHQKQLTVTDDVSFAELLNGSVKLVLGDEKNFKITTPEDLIYAEYLINSPYIKCVTN